MGRRPFRGAGPLGAALLAFTALVPAEADPIAPAALVPALNVYVDALVAGHGVAEVCADANSPARDEAGWVKARAVFLATLWANGFPSDFVNDATKRLDAPAPTATPDCNGEAVFAEFGDADHEGWVKDVGHGISGMELTAIAEPVSSEQWQAIQDAIAKELPLQKRGLDCVAVAMPDLIVVAVHDWDAMLVKMGGELVAAGLPRDQVTAPLSAAEANSLWKRAAPDAAAALAVSCAADKAWSDRFFNLESFALGDTVEKLLPASPSDPDNN